MTLELPSLRRPVRVLAVTLLGAALNSLPVTSLLGTDFLPGGLVVLPLVLVLPPVWAVSAALLAVAPTIFTRGHPFLFAFAGLEAAWLSTAGRRCRSAALADLVFWLAIGIPVGVGLHSQLGSLPVGEAMTILCHQVLTAVTTVLLVEFVVRFTSIAGWFGGGGEGPLTLRGLIFNSVFTLAALPLVVLALGVSILLQTSATQRDETHLQQAIVEVGRLLDTHFRLNRAAVVTAARTIEQSAANGKVLLEETCRAHPDMITMLVSDREGRVIEASPAVPEAFAENVKDRNYFLMARARNEPVVSGVFRGRGFGNDVLVAIATPVHTWDAAFDGIVEASIDVRKFAEAISQTELPRDVHVAVVDATGRVVVGDPAAGLRPLQKIDFTVFAPLLAPETGSGMIHVGVDTAEVRESFYTRMGAASYGMSVIAMKSTTAGLDQVFTVYILVGTIIAGALAASAWLAQVASHRLALPLERFARDAVDQAESGAISEVAPPTERVPREVAMVFAAFNCLVARTRESHMALVQANAELDARVAERTRELRAAQERAEAASRSKTDFVAMTGHEIRTPLNAIIGLADALADDIPSGPAAQRLGTIRRAGKRLLGVVNDLLDLSRVEAGCLELSFQPTEVGGIAREVVGLLKLRAQQQRLSLEVEGDGALSAWLWLDSARLQQVLINLVGNALKFTLVGGVRLQISTVNATTEAMTLRFAIIDSGPGISAEAQKRLFQPYVQLGSAVDGTPGTGLGLSISRRLVEAFGGQLAVRSEPGAGAEFYFTATFRRATPVASVAPPTVKSSADKLRILIVDDNPANQEVLRAFLGRKAARVETAASARDGLAWLEREAFDVALIDLEMPDEGGDVVVREHQRRAAEMASQDCILIAVSAHSPGEKRHECLKLGFAEYLAKPIDRQELMAVLARLCEGRPAIAPAA